MASSGAGRGAKGENGPGLTTSWLRSRNTWGSSTGSQPALVMKEPMNPVGACSGQSATVAGNDRKEPLRGQSGESTLRSSIQSTAGEGG